MTKPDIKPIKSKLIRYIKSYAQFYGKKKICLYANLGHGDLGDDALFLVAKELLGENILPMSKRCYAFNPRIIKALLISSNAALRWESPYIPRRLLTRDRWDFPVMLFSAGINCDYNKEFTHKTRESIKRLCSICDYLGAKDRLTQRFISDLGFRNVRILPDIDLALKERERKLNFNKENFTVGIVLTSHSEFGSVDFQKIIDIFTKFLGYSLDKDRDVIFLPFERKGSPNKKERDIIAEIVKNVNQRGRVRVLEDDLEPDEMLFVIKSYCDLMVCMRLHGSVFSANAGIPFASISYNMMHKGFLEMLEAEDLDISINGFSFEGLKDKFEYVLENRENIKSKLIEKREYLKGLIDKELSYVKRVLKA